MAHKVLLIDDLKSIYYAIDEILKPRGCEITYCNSGQHGLITAQNQVFDLILLDIHMPDANGLEICRELRKLCAYQYRPILLLTSDARNLERALMVGASDYILKPFNEIELIARVFTQLNISKAQLSSIEEAKGLRQNLNSQHLKLEELQKDLHQYFYQTAHKLRSPLSSMEGLFSLMKYEYPEIATNQYVELIEKSVGNLAYVNQQIAKIGDIKTKELCIKSFNLTECLNSLINEKFPDAGIEIEIVDHILLRTDKINFSNGIIPIIENSVYYSNLNNDKKGKIWIRGIIDKDNLIIIIEDNGPGISEDKLQKIYDMFFIGNEYSVGNGLGLFISKTALVKLNIDLKIISKEAKYTKAIITIPHTIIEKKQMFAANQKIA